MARPFWTRAALAAICVAFVGVSLPAQDPQEQVAPAQEPPAAESTATSTPAPAAEGAAPADVAADYELFKAFAETLDQVERSYVKPISRRELMEAAIRGMLDKLDPYSTYIGPQDITQFNTAVESQFGGIGIQIDALPNGRIMVVSPIVGSPAYLAGIQAGDLVIEVDGAPTEGAPIDESIRRMKGEPGTSVKVAVLRPKSGERIELTLERQIVRLDTVLGDRRDDSDRWDFMLDDSKKIGYVRITGFSRETAGDVERALEQLADRGVKGLVLDLRFNPGGLLTSAVDVSDLFLAEGRIVSTAGRNSPEKKWDAKKPGTFEGFPMAVLVNRFSASASEIVSACLQDHSRAVVIGERTWGKGSVQNVIPLEGGKSALKITVAGYLRPNGHNIHREPEAKETDEWGVKPDPGFEVQLDDREMGELVRVRRQRDILQINHYQAKKQEAADGAKDAPPVTPEENKADAAAEKPPELLPIDRQMQKAIEYLDEQIAKTSESAEKK